MAANRTQLQNALHKPYDRLLFSREVLNPVFGSGFSLFSSPTSAAVSPNKSESTVIDQVKIYGKILLDDSTEITCYEVLLQPKVRIEQSKVAIQQYIRKLLTAGQGALINFVSPSTRNVWRLTLVAKDSVLTESGVKEKITNAKRDTFLLGPSETCRTAAERFEMLSTEKEITFQLLKDAFSVEKLSKAFFDEYTLHYQNFCDYLQESNYRKSVFNIDFPNNATREEKDKASKPIRDFVKKLLGRIVFLYFVQKKGWLGASDTDYTDGPGDFIRRLFTDSGGDETFYSNWLTVLFFDTLNKKRTNDDFILPNGKRVKVPFLNGGLFDMEEFDGSLLTFPPALFHHPDFEDVLLTEKNAGYARGFLDFLDAFNFTVYEDSPDDHTVAVDPEMLGHIFENLLEDNKDKGAFYTPKEIVHYMCQESLIEYLATGLQNEYTVYKELGNEQIELFGNEFRKGQLNLIEQLGEKGLDRDEVAYMVKQKDISKLTPKQLLSIDQLLDNVKICDPAIGSGAFPMGLLHEILSLKELIAYETGKAWNPAEAKLNIIQNSIYGVDIEKGAVDIARLRFWLSLVIDEEKPKPLPNLDYKIVVGDSLISRFDGEIIEIDWEVKEGTQTDMFGNENLQNRKQLLQQLTDKQRKYFDPKDKNKQALALEIRNHKIDILINQLELMVKTEGLEHAPAKANFMNNKNFVAACELYQKTQGWIKTIDKLKYLQQHPDEPFHHFDWKLDFPEVLNPYLVPHENQRGFDIVIGNPPYISIRTNSFNKSIKNILKDKYDLAVGQFDIYVLFFELTNKIIRQNGTFSFITPQRILSNETFEKAREFLIMKMPIMKYVNVEMPFENAKVEANIMIGTKSNVANFVDSFLFSLETNKLTFLSEISYSFIKIMPFKIFPFVFDKKRLILLENMQLQNNKVLSDFLEITRGFECGYSDASIVDYETKYPLIKSEAIQKYIVDSSEILFCNPDFQNSSKFKSIELFTKVPKLLTKFTSNEIIFAKDNTGYFNTNSVYNCHLINNQLNYDFLLSILNSKLITFWFNTAFLNIDNLFPHIQKNQLDAIPIKVPNNTKQFELLSQYIQYLKIQNYKIAVSYFQQVIDGMVYELYFPELIEKYDCEIIKYLGELPEFTESMSDEEKMEICQKVYDRLSDVSHPVRIHLEKMKQEIPEIRIIEGLEN